MMAAQHIAYLGPKASFSHQVVVNTFPDDLHHAQSTIEDVFLAVQNCVASIGIVPFENSTNGYVAITLDIFARRNQAFLGDIRVHDEAFLKVHHFLLGRSEHIEQDGSFCPSTSQNAASPNQRTAPSASTKDVASDTGAALPTEKYSKIQKVYSHPQVWGQCDTFLSTHLPHAERKDSSSTSEAAQVVASADGCDGEQAAIANSLAAKVYGLNVLAQNIEENAGNRTRFLIIRKRDKSFINDRDFFNNIKGAFAVKTLLSFIVDENSNNPLKYARSVFEKHQMQVISCDSRPNSGCNVFLAETLLEGSANPEIAITDLLQDLDNQAIAWTWHGSWKAGN